ncbi:F-box protein At3g07870 [Cornus florida]|uniref:F-box protein At3g07870 n=1 Tax=Cornus florida TaxID=4283 RepID=UPI0028A19274|nr:F-box protein At3g07870 [Cornus florida]
MDLGGEKQVQKRRFKLEEDQSTRRNGMESLPRDIALDILSRLPITSVIQSRFVCRSWNMLSHDPHLVNLQFSETANNTPYLIFHSDYPIRNQLYFVDFTDQDDTHKMKEKVKKIRIPFWSDMPEFYVVGSCNGLLCLLDSLYKDALHVYNPFTRDYKELPKSVKFQEQEAVFGFGFHPVTGEYKVVKVVYYRHGNCGSLGARRFRIRDYSQSEVQIYSLGSNSWRSIGKAPYQFERRSSEALVNGRLHWVTRLGRYHGARGRIIVSFDIAEEQFLEVPRPECGGLNRCNYRLTVLGGCLSAVVYCNYGKLEIWVMKDYSVKESWIKEFNIAAYSPKLMNQELQQSYGIWRNILSGKGARVLCLLKNGNLLIEYKGGVIVSYNPESRKFKNLTFQGMPNLFQTVVHVGSLNWIDNPIGM